MNTKNYIIPSLIVTLIALLVFGVIACASTLSMYNNQAKLENQYDMKVIDNQNEYDNLWKKISQVCQLADSKKLAFKDIFTSYAASRTPEDAGKMMLWIKENAPTVDLSVYDKAQNIIVGSRDSFVMRQKELISIAETYNNNLVVQPRGFFLKMFGFKHIDPLIVSSTRSKEAFKTGVDDNVSLTPKP